MRQDNKEIAIETDSIRNVSKNLRHLPSRCRSSRPEVPPGSVEPTFSEKISHLYRTSFTPIGRALDSWSVSHKRRYSMSSEVFFSLVEYKFQ